MKALIRITALIFLVIGNLYAENLPEESIRKKNNDNINLYQVLQGSWLYGNALRVTVRGSNWMLKYGDNLEQSEMLISDKIYHGKSDIVENNFGKYVYLKPADSTKFSLIWEVDFVSHDALEITYLPRGGQANTSTFVKTGKKQSRKDRLNELNDKGLNFFRAKKYSLAINSFRNAYALNSKNEEVLGNLAISYINKGEGEIATIYIEKLIKIASDPKILASAYYNWGLALQKMEQPRPDKAKVKFETSLKYRKTKAARDAIAALK